MTAFLADDLTFQHRVSWVFASAVAKNAHPPPGGLQTRHRECASGQSQFRPFSSTAARSLPQAGTENPAGRSQDLSPARRWSLSPPTCLSPAGPTCPEGHGAAPQRQCGPAFRRLEISVATAPAIPAQWIRPFFWPPLRSSSAIPVPEPASALLPEKKSSFATPVSPAYGQEPRPPNV